ncbi:MAG: wobble nucleotide-excising tRNase, partial [Alphaproteobacteria bacterium]
MVSVKTIKEIKNFGTYKDFNWNKSQIKELAGINIFYGRNYSGKTTLSRIFRAFELGKTPLNLKWFRGRLLSFLFLTLFPCFFSYP